MDPESPERFVQRFESSAEQQIRAAQERGEFDDLEGHGRPIADLGIARPAGWWATKWIETERARSATEALEARRRSLRSLVLRAESTDELKELVAEFNDEVANHNGRVEAAQLRLPGSPGALPAADRHRVEPMNVHEAVDRWYRHRRHQRERARRQGWGFAGR